MLGVGDEAILAGQVRQRLARRRESGRVRGIAGADPVIQGQQGRRVAGVLQLAVLILFSRDLDQKMGSTRCGDGGGIDGPDSVAVGRIVQSVHRRGRQHDQAGQVGIIGETGHAFGVGAESLDAGVQCRVGPLLLKAWPEVFPKGFADLVERRREEAAQRQADGLGNGEFWPDWFDAITLTDAHVDEVFVATRASGPRAHVP